MGPFKLRAAMDRSQTVHYNRLIPYYRPLMDTDYVDQETVRPKTLPAGSIQYVGPALGAGARVAARHRQFLVNLIRAETTESDNAAAGESLIESTLSVSSNGEQRPSNDLSGGMINMTEYGAQQAAAEPLLNPSSTPSICYFSNHTSRLF